MHTRLIYLDHNATTRVAPEVIEAMLPFFTEQWGNPSSAYTFGHQLTKHLDEARGRVAALLNAEAREIVFTSCGTESNNTAIHSALATQPDKRHIVTTAVEHSATLKYAAFLQKHGVEVTFLPVETSGSLDLEKIRTLIRPDTALVSVMWANNETGVVYPVREIASICHEKGTLFHTDAVQVPGKIAIDVQENDLDFLSLSAHKLAGPKGIGALFVRRRLKYQPYIVGGGQERGRRGGTENVAGIVGFGRAAELARVQLTEENTRVRVLRDRLECGILGGISGVARNGASEPRLPNTTNLAFEGVEAEGVLLMLDREGVCASSGSACTTGSLEPSHVLTAMGCAPARARGSLRFSLGVENTDSDIDHVLDCLPRIITKLRVNLPPME
jgi:cysteine desulfurase